MRIVHLLCGAVLVVGCSSADSRGLSSTQSDDRGGDGNASAGDPKHEAAPGAEPSASGDPGSSQGTGSAEAEPVAAGTLTAGTWDDNRNFERFLGYRAHLAQQQRTGIPPFSDAEHLAANTTFSVLTGARTKLDIALVIDTTGSMGDELRYLQTEFDALATSVRAKFPGAEQRWSLVVYKDAGDSYVTRGFDFTADAGEFRGHLAAQSAGGGGDFPEAADEALARANGLAWRGEDTAKLLFWVADAPHHDNKAAALATEVRNAQARGIHVYPVASSGIDELTELSMRSAAQMTGGRYLFLTDDSRVGGAHKEPSIPCYFVTKLDRAILRMVDIELTGRYREPDAADVVRRSGDPQSGICTLAGGAKASVF